MGILADAATVAGLFGSPVVVVVPLMVSKQVSSDSCGLCLFVSSLWSSWMALGILGVPSSILIEVSASEEWSELVVCSDSARNQGVVIGVQGFWV